MRVFWIQDVNKERNSRTLKRKQAGSNTDLNLASSHKQAHTNIAVSDHNQNCMAWYLSHASTVDRSDKLDEQ